MRKRPRVPGRQADHRSLSKTDFESEKGLRMLADAHRKAAEDIESTILPLQAQPRAARVVIEGAWGAAFQWLAFGCETKYQHHLNNHTRVGRFLRSLGEKA